MQTFTNTWQRLCLLAGWALTALPAATAAGLGSPGIDVELRQAATPQQLAHEAPLRLDTSQAAPLPPISALDDWLAIDSALLDQMRGGFTVEPGLKISFGIERSVSINGALQTVTKFDFQDAGKFAANGLSAGALQLIQNGLGNSFLPGDLSQSSAATFIQNSLNNQTIQSLTVINASTNSLALMKGMNLHTTLQDAVTHTTGVR